MRNKRSEEVQVNADGVGALTPERRSQMEADVKRLCQQITGTRGEFTAWRHILNTATLQIRNRPQDAGEVLATAIEAMAEMQVTNSMEAMFATQMIGVHEAAVSFLATATGKDQTLDGRNVNLGRATKLMRLFLEQVEAMQRLKGKSGQQKVTVEHVHVHEGGQAIVGAVSLEKLEEKGGGR